MKGTHFTPLDNLKLRLLAGLCFPEWPSHVGSHALLTGLRQCLDMEMLLKSLQRDTEKALRHR